MHTNYEQALAQKIWAVVGVSENQESFACKIYKQLQSAGYTVYAVNPRLKELFGETCYASLSALPERPDAVSVVVRPEIGINVVQEAANLGIPYLWLQPGANAPEVISRGGELGLKVIGDACLLVALREL